MKQLILLFSLTILFTSANVKNNFAYEIKTVAPAGEYDELINVIKNKLEGKCVGYQVTISHNGQNPFSFAGGYARLKQNAPELKMSGSVKFHTASVSKTITAMAMLRVLENIDTSLDINLSRNLFFYLPRHWKIHETIKTININQLLTHTSGLRKDFGVDYEGLKKLSETSINMSDKYVKDYQNTNFAFMRMIIPLMAKKQINGFFQTEESKVSEVLQAMEFATFYRLYVQDSVFSPAGVDNVMTAVPSYIGGLCYQFPHFNKKGEAFSNAAMTVGSHGWVLSTQELDKVMSAFYYTEKIVSAKTRKKMMERLYGFDRWGTTPKGYKYLTKGGYYPGSRNDGELHTWVVHFEEGYDMSIIINSPYLQDEGDNFYAAAFDEWYRPIIKKMDKRILDN